MGTAGGPVVVMVSGVHPLFGVVRLTPQVRHGQRDFLIDRFLQDQQQPGSIRQVALGRVPESVVTTAVKTSRQDVLQEPLQELHTGNALGLLGIAAVFLPV